MATGSFKLPISSGSTEWVRPSDWLAMPTGITNANQTFVGLHAVFPEGNNFCSFRFNTSAGQYRVDWGDGVVDLVNSGVTASHEYNYATYDTGNTTLSSRGYKQAFVTVTAVSGNLTNCNFAISYPSTPAQTTGYSSGFLDCILSMPNAASASSITIGNGTPAHRYVERFDIKTIGSCTSLSGLFGTFNSLQSVALFNTQNVTTMGAMFINCSSLKSVPLFNTQSVTNMASMFQSCTSLQSVPLFNTQSVTTMGSMFQNCPSLQSVPLFNTQSVTNMSSMLRSCNVLKEVPLFNTSNVTNMSGMFNSSPMLRTIPLFNTQNVTDMSNMFSACQNLQSLPLLNTANVTNMNAMFIFSNSINSIPAFSTASITTTSGTDFGGFTQGCPSVDRIQIAFARTVTISSCQLSRTALVEIFNNLVNRSATTSATINISGNWGASALTAGERAIATGKNWVIVG